MKRFLLLLACGWVPVVVGTGKVREAAGLVALAAAPHPYMIASHATLLYLWTPLVVASGCVAVMTPGLLLCLESRRDGLELWIARAFAASLLVVSVSASLTQFLLRSPVTGGIFLAVLACVSIPCGLWGGRRVRTRREAWRPAPPASPGAFALILIVPAVLFVALLPKFLWESFNGDGAHAFEIARLAAHQFLPFWDSSAGPISSFPGMSTVLFAFPASWFVRLFGELEVSVRAPYLLAVVAVYCTIVAVASQGRPARDRALPVLVWLGLTVYTVVQAYSSTYDPYSADLAMPGLPDTLQVFAFLGFVQSYLARRWSWTTGFLILTLLSSPSGLVLAVFWLGAIAVCLRRSELSEVRRGAVLLVAVVAGTMIVPAGLKILALPVPGSEHAIGALITRFAFLQFTDWRRILWVVVPSGIFPFGALLLWRRLDAIGRALLLVTGVSFAMFYVQAYVMLHQFVPAMLLPLAAVWRIDSAGWIRWRIPIAVTTGAVALWGSLPVNGAPVVAARQVGSAIDDRVTGYAQFDPAAFRRFQLLGSVFPKDYDASVPDETYGGAQLAWSYYAHHRTGGEAEANYILIGPGEAPPEGAAWHAANEAGALFIRSDEAWQRHRGLRPPTPAGSPLYWTPRGMLFGRRPLHGGPWILDLPAWLSRLGVDVDAVARALGRPPSDRK